MTRKLLAAFILVVIAVLLAPVVAAQAQAPPSASTSAVGTATAVHADNATIDLKPDQSDPVVVKITPDTIFQRVAPGATDLKSAQPVAFSEVGAGDRLLVTFKTGTTEARRVVVIAASEINKRNQADRLDWTRRGISGVVTEKKGNEITVNVRTLLGVSRATVTIGDKTSLKRYAPDSVKFADAKPSSLSEVTAGDQLRARGQKSEDGLKVTAEEIVFGTFQTRAGTVLSVDAAEKQITVKDLVTNKQLVIKVSGDSQLKKFPAVSQQMLSGLMGGGQPAAAGAPGAAKAPGAAPAAAGAAQGPGAAKPAGAVGAPGGAAGAQAAAARMDLNQVLEMMPPGKVEDIKPGEIVLVSSTKGAQSDHVTAITLIANAEMLIQLAVATSGANRTDVLGMQLAGSGGGMGGLSLSGMMQ